MQNNVTELTDKLLRALDTNYNVTDMQTVVDIIVLLDKVAITKEVLEATRLGRHVNELRRNTSNDWLAKRAKELVKKWRNLVLAPLQQQHQHQHQQQSHEHSVTTTNNGQVKQQQTIAHAPPPIVRDKVAQLRQDVTQTQEDSGGGSRKRSAKEKLDTSNSGVTSKRPRVLNGGSELDLSDTSNSSFHDAVLARNELRLAKTFASAPSVILVNSDSNSSIPDFKSQLTFQDSTTPQPAALPSNSTLTPPLTSPSSTSSLPQPLSTSPALPTTTVAATQQPPPTTPSSNSTSAAQRRRGRRKGSSAHRNLLDEADASFNSKMARGANARVKTTQELVASLSSLASGGRVVGGVTSSAAVVGGKATGSGAAAATKEDLVQKAAKLTERVVEIDQKLNTNANRYKNNGGSTLATSTSNKHHHHHRHNNNNNINSLSNNLDASEGDDEDVIVVDDVLEVSARQQDRRRRKRRDSGATRGLVDNVTVKYEDDKGGLDSRGTDGQSEPPPARSLDTALALSLLPPIDRSFLSSSPPHTSHEPPDCSCRLVDNSHRHIPATVINKKRSDFSIGSSDDDDDQDDQHPQQQQQQQPEDQAPPYEWEADDDCLAGEYLQQKYRLCGDLDSMVNAVHERYVPGVNCNSQQQQQQQVIVTSDNVVPDVYRDLRRKLEAYKPYSISETGGGDTSAKLETDDKDRTAAATSEVMGGDNDLEYREYHEVLDVPSYNGEVLRILPYVIID